MTSILPSFVGENEESSTATNTAYFLAVGDFIERELEQALDETLNSDDPEAVVRTYDDNEDDYGTDESEYRAEDGREVRAGAVD